MLNIPSYIEDPSYRYTMPALFTKVEGRGNGIRTKLLNLTEVAKHLRVPVEYPLRYFGGEFCTQTENKREKNGALKIMINGNFSSKQLQDVLDRFIEKFVLCPRCHYPEIDIQVTKKGTLASDCVACGANCQLDLTHKLSSYIVKHPPPITREQRSKREANDKRQEEAKVPTRSKRHSAGVEEHVITVDSSEVLESIQALSEMRQSSSKELSNVIRGLSLTKGLSPTLRIYSVLTALFETKLVQQLKDRKMLKLLKAQVEGQEEAALLALCAIYVPMTEMHRYLPTAFKFLFDGEVFTEKFLHSWNNAEYIFDVKNSLFDAEKLSTLKGLIQSFLDWLEEAEEEEVSDDEEEEEEDEAKVKQKALIAKQKAALEVRPEISEERRQQADQPPIDLMKPEEDEDDIDIDDI